MIGYVYTTDIDESCMELYMYTQSLESTYIAIGVLA
jgi:hypothetical protein